MSNRPRIAVLLLACWFTVVASFASGEVPKEMQDDAQWTVPGKNYSLTRYSTLDQITSDNAKSLKAAWTFSLGVNRGQEAPPLVVGDRMYVVTPYPNILYCLQLLDPSKDPEHRYYAL